MPRRRAPPPKAGTAVPSTAQTPARNDDPPSEVRRSLAQWTDEQEIALLKGIVKWKPAGVHKHFRMQAIHNFMTSQGVINPQDEHTTIPGLWIKLGSLYNLPLLDEREDSILHTSSSSSSENGSPAAHLLTPYDLPEPESEAVKFDKKINLEGSKSPAPVSNSRGQSSTVADTDEAAASSPAPGARRGGRAMRRGGRISKLQQQDAGSGNRRKTSKAASATTEDETMEDTGEGEDGEGDGESEEAGDLNHHEGMEDSPKAKAVTTRARGGLKGRLGGRGRGSARNRGRRR